MHGLVKQIFDEIGDDHKSIAYVSDVSGVGKSVVHRWVRNDATPRLDLFCYVAEAAGFEVTLKRKAMKMRLEYRNGRLEAFRNNKLAGYVENDELFAIGKDGFAVSVGSVNHRSEVIGKLNEWITNQP